ncbi:hypothetical protein, partial [Pseudomonas chlororaphis]|uniref:hypothetical protein n=1 Tax=Pseudomonas chlororaphis TaxID=587753 RepID=UPI0038BDA530
MRIERGTVGIETIELGIEDAQCVSTCSKVRALWVEVRAIEHASPAIDPTCLSFSSWEASVRPRTLVPLAVVALAIDHRRLDETAKRITPPLVGPVN